MEPYSILKRSKEQYQEMFDITKQIGDKINTLDTLAIGNYLEQLTILLEEAKIIDSKINLLRTTDLTGKSKSIFSERRDIMNQFMILNDDVAAKVSAKKAVVQSEFQKIKNGRTGLQGYHSAIKKPNRFFNNTA